MRHLSAQSPLYRLLGSFFLFLVIGCSGADFSTASLSGEWEEEEISPGSSKSKKKKKKEDEGGSSRLKEGGRQYKRSSGNVPGDSGAVGQDQEDPTEEDKDEQTDTDGDEDNETEDDQAALEKEREAARKLIEDCGSVDPKTFSYNRSVVSLPFIISKSGIPIIGTIFASLRSELKISSNNEKTTQSSSVPFITKFDVSPQMQRVADGVNAKLPESTSNISLTNVPFLEVRNIQKTQKDWKGIVCTLVAAKEVSAQRGNFSALTKFDRPIPSAISPRATSGRYSQEIGSSKTFSNITATVVNSSNPNLSVGTYTGSVSITQVNPQLVTSDGSPLLVADIAYNVRTQFGNSDTVTFAMGLTPEVTYFISHSKKDYRGTAVDNKIEGNPSVYFVYP